MRLTRMNMSIPKLPGAVLNVSTSLRGIIQRALLAFSPCLNKLLSRLICVDLLNLWSVYTLLPSRSGFGNPLDVGQVGCPAVS